jgi:hypothetical protein
MKPILVKDLGQRMYSNRNRRFGLFRCSFCEKDFECLVDRINQGHKKSCGCSTSKLKGDAQRTHNLKDHRLYKVWSQIKQRCLNKKNVGYENYGGRGIGICNKWEKDFKTFYDWCIENHYMKGLTIDRIDNDKGYSPDNCRVTTYQVQNCNKRYRSKNTYIGVNKQGNIYVASLSINDKKVHIGCFKTEKEAALARDNYILQNKLDNKLNFKE